MSKVPVGVRVFILKSNYTHTHTPKKGSEYTGLRWLLQATSFVTPDSKQKWT